MRATRHNSDGLVLHLYVQDRRELCSIAYRNETEQ